MKLPDLHSEHECIPGRCQCFCGCQIELRCTNLFGPYCSVCSVKNGRGYLSHMFPEDAKKAIQDNPQWFKNLKQYLLKEGLLPAETLK